MSLKRCPDCKEQVSASARECPKCGRPQPSGAAAFAPVIVTALMILGLIWWFIVGLPAQTRTRMQDIDDQVASDAEAQYRIAAKQGDRMQMCVQAGLVAAAHLQAQHSAQYDSWKSVEKIDCETVGILH